RRFQTVMVDEPDTLSSISILRGLKERYENHHKVRIQDDAVIAAVQLSQRYITERFLPDKAIDLMDEAAAKLRMERDSVPEELDEISRRLKQLEIEREAIRREKNLSNSSLKGEDSKLSNIEEEIADLREQEQKMRGQWENEKRQADQIQTLKDRMQQLRNEAEQAERDGDYAKVAEIRYSKLPELEKQLAESSAVSNKLLRDEVTADDIADVVSRWTGIPVSKMQTSETEKLLHLEEELHKRVIGQEEAIAAVSNAVRRSRAGLQDPKRPIGSFIFLGSTGVGKTELAKALAEYLFDDETMMTRIDMSEYQEKFSVTRLIGAPPGYVGYDEGGQLTEAVRRKPYQVVLFDEIEKAHPDVFNTLLQVLDDGRLTDSKGRTVNFKNTIIIMTSNLLTGADLDKGEQDVRDMLVQRGIRPEFLNRIDEIIVFHPLNWGEVKQIVRLQVESVQKMLRENGLTLEISDEAIDLLANEGYDPDFGARPVKRTIQRLLLDDLSKSLLAGRLDRNRPIRVDAKDGKLTME
ncbi:MAG: AAA family ATPase, partial [Bacteroidaceae bacterium]|nr:AAA family ATPase [Bacteroidaceae bacterium]